MGSEPSIDLTKIRRRVKHIADFRRKIEKAEHGEY